MRLHTMPPTSVRGDGVAEERRDRVGDVAARETERKRDGRNGEADGIEGRI